MNKKYVVIALVATIAIAVLAQAEISAMKKSANVANGNGFYREKMTNCWRNRDRWMEQEMNNFSDETMNCWRNRERIRERELNYLNTTREEGTLEYIDGKYYVNGIEIYFGNEFFLATTSRSDYDMDGSYETVKEEISGLVGSNVIINGLLENGILYASHINGIWLRPPCYNEFTELQGVLEKINGSYYINGIKLIIKQGFSKSDIDRDGSLERMYEELNGLVGKEVKIDGLLKDDSIVVMHINGIWAR